MTLGYVYVLKNRAFKEVKIGRTTKNPEERADDLSGTGSPHPFKVAYSVYVDDCRMVEQKVHEHLAEYRLSRKREFFRVSVEEAKEAIDLFATYKMDAWDLCAAQSKPKKPKKSKSKKSKAKKLDPKAEYLASIDDRTKGPAWPKNPNLRGDVPRPFPTTEIGWMQEHAYRRISLANAIESDKRIQSKRKSGE